MLLCILYHQKIHVSRHLGLLFEAALTVFIKVLQDTVSTDEEDDEVKAHDHPRRRRASVCHDPIIHNSVPVFSSQDLTLMRIYLRDEHQQHYIMLNEYGGYVPKLFHMA